MYLNYTKIHQSCAFTCSIPFEQSKTRGNKTVLVQHKNVLLVTVDNRNDYTGNNNTFESIHPLQNNTPY